MSTLDHRGLGPILGVLHPAGQAVEVPHAVAVRMYERVLLPRCAECRTPMHPAQNARRTSIGWMCMMCFERGVLYSTVTVATLPPLSRWRRLLAWFIKPPLPVARARER